jgi:hypothetical protein
LLGAIQERCGFAEGELRVVMLESQPIHRPLQHYRIVDAATGVVEAGYVRVADMTRRQPWLDEDGTIPAAQLVGAAPSQRLTATAEPASASPAPPSVLGEA